MSSSSSTALGYALAMILPQLPTLLVWLVGLVLALVYWKRHPHASGRLVTGLVILAIVALLGTAQNAAMPWLAQRYGASSIALVSGVSGIVRGVIAAVGWAFMVSAVFGDRPKTAPAGAPQA